MTPLTAGDIVWVPFPHVEGNRHRPRPALIVATGLGSEARLCWALMITNADRAAWPGDVTIDDYRAAGLPIPSKVRTAKIATLDGASATRIGTLPDVEMDVVRTAIQRLFLAKGHAE